MIHKTQELANLPLENRGWIAANVEFGQRLANGKCGHIGICNVSDASLPIDAPIPRYRRCRQAVAHIGASNEGRPVFYFPKEKMLPCTQRAFFRGASFMVATSFELPSHWHILLPQLRAFILAEGKYPIERYGAGFLIRF